MIVPGPQNGYGNIVVCAQPETAARIAGLR